MVRLLGWAVMLGGFWIFLNWEAYSTDVEEWIQGVDRAAQATHDSREAIQHQIQQLILPSTPLDETPQKE
jgi:hypothetical protein